MAEMTKKQMQMLIALRAADELEPHSFNNLGVGIPTMISELVPPEKDVWFQGENGVIGVGSAAFDVINNTNAQASDKAEDPDIIDSSGFSKSVNAGASFFDSSVSFTMIRGGHIHTAVLGTMEVAENGDIANYMIPGKALAGMGGAMDLCTGVQRVIVTSFHTQGGRPKLLKKCTLPLTAVGAVKTVVTEMGVFDVKDGHFVVREYNPNYTKEEIQAATEAELDFSSAKELDQHYIDEALKVEE